MQADAFVEVDEQLKDLFPVFLGEILLLEPPLQNRSGAGNYRRHAVKVEPSSKRVVDLCERSVGRVHRP